MSDDFRFFLNIVSLLINSLTLWEISKQEKRLKKLEARLILGGDDE